MKKIFSLFFISVILFFGNFVFAEDNSSSGSNIIKDQKTEIQVNIYTLTKNKYLKQLILSKDKLKKLKQEKYITYIDKVVSSVENDKLKQVFYKIQILKNKNEAINYLEAVIYLKISNGVLVNLNPIESIKVTDEKYFYFNKNTQTITGYNPSGGTDLVIPSIIDGVEVKNIGQNAFSNYGLTSVVIPNTVIKIGDYSKFINGEFYSLTINGPFSNNKLTNIVIPNSVTTIGTSAFSNNKLTNIVIPDSVTTIGNMAFHKNNLTNIFIPSSIINIGYSSFGSNKLENVKFSEGLKNIGGAAFYANNLKNIEIPSSIENIGGQAFRYNFPDNIINYDGYISSDYIYTGTGAGIEINGYFGNEKNIIIPSTINGKQVISIGDSAFYNNFLTSVVIPEGVISIGDYAFSWNELTNIFVPDSITTIGKDVFLIQNINSSSGTIYGPKSGYFFEAYKNNYNNAFSKDELSNYIGIK